MNFDYSMRAWTVQMRKRDFFDFRTNGIQVASSGGREQNKMKFGEVRNFE